MNKLGAGFLIAGVALAAGLAPKPLANADGLNSFTEDTATLRARAQRTIELIEKEVPLGPYESASTVLQFVNNTLRGIDTPIACTQIMAMYASGRTRGTINAPLGPGLN